MSKNKGITLIALIITIIILLILVGVSVNLLIKGDLFGSAEKAVNGTNAKVEEEQTRVDELMGKLEDVNAKNSRHNWQYTDSTRAKIRCTCEKCKAFNDGDSTGRTLSIGQEIMYTATGGTSSLSPEKSGGNEYVTDLSILGNNVKVASLETNKNLIIAELAPVQTTQTISADSDTRWVVFGYEDNDKDGLNEVLLLTTVHPTTNKIYFYGAAGYNNAVEEINRMCKELYGTNARGMTIEDVNRALGYTPAGRMYYLNNKWNTTGNLTTKLKDLGDMWTAITDYNTNSEAGVFYDPSHPEGISDSGVALGEYLLDGYWYITDDLSSNIADSAKAMIFGSNKTNYGYWLASHGVVADSNCAYFGPGHVNYGDAYSCGNLFSSGGGAGDDRFGLRPLVSLTSEIPVAGQILDFSGKFGGYVMD